MESRRARRSPPSSSTFTRQVTAVEATTAVKTDRRGFEPRTRRRSAVTPAAGDRCRPGRYAGCSSTPVAKGRAACARRNASYQSALRLAAATNLSTIGRREASYLSKAARMSPLLGRAAPQRARSRLRRPGVCPTRSRSVRCAAHRRRGRDCRPTSARCGSSESGARSIYWRPVSAPVRRRQRPFRSPRASARRPSSQRRRVATWQRRIRR